MVNFPNLTVNADGFAAGYFGSLEKPSTQLKFNY